MLDFFEKIIVGGVDEKVRLMTLIVTMLSVYNFLRIGTQWASRKRNKFSMRLQNYVHFGREVCSKHFVQLMKTVHKGFQ